MLSLVGVEEGSKVSQQVGPVLQNRPDQGEELHGAPPPATLKLTQGRQEVPQTPRNHLERLTHLEVRRGGERRKEREGGSRKKRIRRRDGR